MRSEQEISAKIDALNEHYQIVSDTYYQQGRRTMPYEIFLLFETETDAMARALLWALGGLGDIHCYYDVKESEESNEHRKT